MKLLSVVARVFDKPGPFAHENGALSNLVQK